MTNGLIPRLLRVFQPGLRPEPNSITFVLITADFFEPRDDFLTGRCDSCVFRSSKVRGRNRLVGGAPI